MTQEPSRSPWLRVLPPLAVSIFLLLRPRGPSFDELRFALCLTPWLLLSGWPRASHAVGDAPRDLAGNAPRREATLAAIVPLALALPILGLALSTTSSFPSKWLLLYGAALIFILAFAAERAARGTRRERTAHAAGWLVLVPLPLALSLAASFSNSTERRAVVHRWSAWSPPAVVVTDALRSSPPSFPDLSASERQVLIRHGAFAKIFGEDLPSAAEPTEEPASPSNSKLWALFRDLIPAVITSLALLALSCSGGQMTEAEDRFA